MAGPRKTFDAALVEYQHRVGSGQRQSVNDVVACAASAKPMDTVSVGAEWART